MKIINKFSAISSWQGYEYQGHIAVYEMLKILNEKTEEECSGYMLEIEGTEDFSIFNNGICQSVHQVKSGTFSDNDRLEDKYAFIMTILENDNAKGYYHVEKKGLVASDYVDSAVNQIDKILKQLDYESNTEAGDPMKKRLADLFDIKDIKYIRNSPSKGSARSAVVNNLDDAYRKLSEDEKVTKILEIIDALSELLSEYKESLVVSETQKPKKDTDFMREHEEYFKKPREIKEKSYELLHSIYCRNFLDYAGSSSEDDYYKVIYALLFECVKDEIEQTLFQNKSNKIIKGAQIHFECVLSFMNKDFNAKMQTEHYLKVLFTEAVKDAKEEFLEIGCEKELCADCQLKKSCNLYKEIDVFLELKDKKKLIENLSLFSLERAVPNNIISSDDALTRLCNPIFKSGKLKIDDDKIMTVVENRNHYLTVDGSSHIVQMAKKLGAYYDYNPSVVKLLFDSSTIVSERLSEGSILFSDFSTARVDRKGREELMEKVEIDVQIADLEKDFTRMEPIKLMSIDTFIEENSDDTIIK